MSFAVGEMVRTKKARETGHTRLPAYLAEKEGRVERVAGEFALADSRAAGEKPPRREKLYTVVFDGNEVWGAAKGGALSISANLFESYLEAVKE